VSHGELEVGDTVFRAPPPASKASSVGAIAMLEGASDSTFRCCDFDEYARAGGLDSKAFAVSLFANLTLFSVSVRGLEVSLKDKASFFSFSSNLTDLRLDTEDCTSCVVVVVASAITPLPVLTDKVNVSASFNRIELNNSSPVPSYHLLLGYAGRQYWPFCLRNGTQYAVRMDLQEELPGELVRNSFGFGISLPVSDLNDLNATFNGATLNSSSGQLFSRTHSVFAAISLNPGVRSPSCYMIQTEPQPIVANVSNSTIRPIAFSAVFQLNSGFRRQYVLEVTGTNKNEFLVERSRINLTGGTVEDSLDPVASTFVVSIADANLERQMYITIGDCRDIIGIPSPPSCGNIVVDVNIVNGIAVFAVSGPIVLLIIVFVAVSLVRFIRLAKRLKLAVSASQQFVLTHDPKVCLIVRSLLM
jgi:hypothetical protein